MILIDFDEDERKSHAMDPVFCLGKLEVLDDDHILSKHRSNPEEVELMAKKEPVNLIIEILSKSEDGCSSTREIEKILGYLLGPAKPRNGGLQPRNCWLRIRELRFPIKKPNPMSCATNPLNRSRKYSWTFSKRSDPRKRSHLAEKLFDLATEKEALHADLPQVLHELTVAIMEARNLSQADRLYGIWVRNNLARDAEEDVEKLEPTSASILNECEGDLPVLADQMPTKFHSRFLDLVTRVYPENWKPLIVNLLQNTAVKFSGESPFSGGSRRIRFAGQISQHLAGRTKP